MFLDLYKFLELNFSKFRFFDLGKFLTTLFLLFSKFLYSPSPNLFFLATFTHEYKYFANLIRVIISIEISRLAILPKF